MEEIEIKPKQKKEFSFDQYHERQIALKVAYIGWDLKGFTSQENSQETVEYHLFEAFLRAKLIKDPKNCYYSLAGRTDAGVSGFGNVISLRVRSVYPFGIGSIPNEKAKSQSEELNYIKILNGILPDIIRIIGISYVPLTFNARFECISRGYRYFFHKLNKDINKMKIASQFLIGEHDYRNFCKFSPESTKHCIRTIYSIEFNNLNDELSYFEIVGSGFIWHQIRCIATILFFIGEGFEDISIINDLLDIKKYPGRPCYPIADPEPLMFWKANYENIEWILNKELEDKINLNFSKILINLQIKTSVLKCFINNNLLINSKKKYKKINKLEKGKSIEQILIEFEKNNKIIENLDE